ncbi:MAG TPA: hypothetical protein VEK11_18525 [Thermoanaerobaculia bacterium]|nr:hypothetical protein [Thermoanaerobaculia bacterium]
MADTFISAQEAARRTGLSTGALAKRRYLKAPNGWIYISSNAVVYPEDEVERFVTECRTAQHAFRRPPMQRRRRNGEDPR